MLELRSHLVRLLIQILYLDLSRSDVSLKLFDFVVKHELELLKLLRLLLEFEYPVVFLLDGLLALQDLLLLRLDLSSYGGYLVYLVSEISLRLVNLLNYIVTLEPRVLEPLLANGQVGLVLHASLDDSCELLLVLLSELVEDLPGPVVVRLPLQEVLLAESLR
jgi:hypothetical protein